MQLIKQTLWALVAYFVVALALHRVRALRKRRGMILESEADPIDSALLLRSMKAKEKAEMADRGV